MGRPSPERRFADRPVAWEEHDDSDVPRAPEPNHLQMLQIALGFRDSVANEADRILAFEGDTPNDRIPHERRRSIRASWVLIAWLSILDPSSINTIDSYVEANGRRFVRHHFFDFGCSFGSATDYVEGLQEDGEYVVEVGRTLASIFTLGLYRRPFQDDAHRQEWIRLRAEHPALGAFPADSFDPDTFRTNLKVPTFMRMTARDAYWGAKLVTSFTDEQIAAIVATARLDRADAEYLEGALRVRRDIIGRRYLRAVTAVEEPQVSTDGTALCFEDRAGRFAVVGPERDE